MTQQLRLLFGTSHAIRQVLAESVRFARTRYPLLILGAPGTGKTVLARHIHMASAREGAFVKESCAAIPEHLEVSHLAGHTRGAFTGAERDRVGLLESAHTGTFFLDELGLASPKVQGLLLHLLEDGSVRRVGEVRDRPVDVRFIGATNADLRQMADRREFRQDLLDRFGYLTITMPPLSERRDEILTLADLFLRREAAALGMDRPAMSEEVRACLLAAPWSGNIRELEAVCRYAVLSATHGEPIEMCDLPADFVATLGEVLQSRHEQSAAERARQAVSRAGGNKTRAARMLGITRQQLYRLLAATGALVLWAHVTFGHTAPSAGRHALHLRAHRAVVRTAHHFSV